MHMFRSKADIYEWFREIQGWNRMDFICNLIHLCNPFELRFIGACIEDMAQTDYNTLRDQELKANSVENLEQFVNKCPPVDEFRSHISVCLALLQSSNYKVASKLAVLLDDKLEGLNLEHLMQAGLDAEVEQWMLMLTLAAYHPAFSFEKKLNFKSKLMEYEKVNKKERKTTWCSRRSHRCSPSQHATIKYEECNNSEWRADVNPDLVPFRNYSIYPQTPYSYVGYNPDPYQGNHSLGNTQDVFARPQNMRPSTFPAAFPPSGIGDANYAITYPQNPDLLGYNINSPRDERTKLPFNRTPELPMQGFTNNALSVPVTLEYSAPPRSTASQSTVPQPHTCSNVTSVLSTVVTSAVIVDTTPHSTQYVDGKYMSWGSGYRTSSATKPRQFSTISNSDNGGNDQSLNRTCSETQKSKNRNRSQSGDVNNSSKQPWRKTHGNTQKIEPLQSQLRTSTSAPSLVSMKEERTYSSNFKEENTRKNGQFLRKKEDDTVTSFIPKHLKPLNVSVNVIPKNKKEGPKPEGGTCFRLKVEWSDGTTSECDHSVEDMVKFYKKVSAGKMGKKVINSDFLTKQNNQILERRKQLEGIFRDVLSSTLNGSNIDEFMTFFKYNATETPASSSLPFKKRIKHRPGSKSRVALDGSSSSSSTASPPLVNTSKSRLISPSNSRPESSVSPLSAKESFSTGSALSSPTSGATVTSMTSLEDEAVQDNDDTRNDPYLKLYYWLKEKRLVHRYTNLKKYTFDEFCKLQPCDINSFGFLTSEEMAILNEELSKMKMEVWPEQPRNDATTALDIDMGTLSLSSKRNVTTSDCQSDGSKSVDIKSILDDVARITSEDEKSGSSQSAPVAFEMPNPDGAEVVESNSCFSFVFDTSSATGDSSTRSSGNNPPNDEDPVPQNDSCMSENIGYYCPSSRHFSGPGRSWSQADMGLPNEYPTSTVAPVYLPRSAPPMTQMTYYPRPSHPDQMNPNAMMVPCYHVPPQPVMPCSVHTTSTSTVSAGSQPNFTQPPIMALTSPMLSISGQKQTQYAYTVTSTTPTSVMYPSHTSFYPVHSMTSPVGDGVTVTPILYMNSVTSPAPGVENSYSSVATLNSDSNERVSPASSDPDSSSKLSEVSTPTSMSFIPADRVLPNRPGPGPTNFYNPAARFQYSIGPQWNPQMHQHHPLAPTYSDPSHLYASPKNTNDSIEYQPLSATRGTFAMNGYADLRNTYSFPILGRNRGMPPRMRHFSGDAPKRMNAVSCYNCGRKGHNASICRDPNAVEVLGTDFHLEMSQSSNRRVNE